MHFDSGAKNVCYTNGIKGYMNNLSTTTLIGFAVVLAMIASLLLAFSQNTRQQLLLSITNFDECVAEGFPIMESYPERCATPDGRTFVNERQQPYDKKDLQASECAIAGCSGELCVSAYEAENILTTCEYRTEHRCYENAQCELQANEECGWTKTDELKACLKNTPPLNALDLKVY